MGVFSKIKSAVKHVERAATGRGKIGKWNLFAAPERHIVRPLRHKIGLTRNPFRSDSSALSISAGLPSASYVGNTGFRRFV